MSVRSLLQETLDNVLAADRVYSHWGRKQPISGENPGEYVVYTIDSDLHAFWTDNAGVLRAANPTIRYYHAFGMTEADVAAREQQIYDALRAAGFSVDSGPFDTGDIDDVSMNTTIFDCTFSRLSDG